jgi:DNA-binding IclR family transcriptional regulator
VHGRVLPLVPEHGDIASETSSTLKAIGVLEVLVRAGRAVTLTELMQATELPKPTLHRTLTLFEEAGWLVARTGRPRLHHRRAPVAIRARRTAQRGRRCPEAPGAASGGQ